MFYASVLIFVLVAVISLAVDGGRVVLVRTELQRATDSAARAAAADLNISAATAVSSAVAYAAKNTADGTSVIIANSDVETGVWDLVSRTFTPGGPAASVNAVRVTARRSKATGNAIPLAFAQMIGMPTCDVSARSVATLGAAKLDYSAGFTGVTDLALNGSATLVGSALQMTTTTGNLRGSAWYQTRQPVNKFSTTFTFQITSPAADGITFTVQKNAATSMGAIAVGLGYSGMGNSVAVKFDIYNNSGEGSTSTGLFLNGATPTNVGSYDTSATLNLRSGNVMRVTLDYDGTTLTESITDLTTNAVYTRSYTVDIPSVVGGSSAYVGFTASTGGSSALQKILTWTYTGQGGAVMVR